MKKSIITLCALSFFTLSVNAWDASERVSVVGQTLLEKNGLPSIVTFKVVEGVADNSEAITTNVINISKEDLIYAGNDSEVAAVVSNELGHIINGQTSKTKMRELAKQAIANKLGSENILSSAANSQYIINKTNLNDEMAADITGIDLICKTGYNPLAMVVLITKRPTISTLETLQGKPNNSERAMNAFDYLTYAYPDRVKSDMDVKNILVF
jgi:predicted Zn-dependent protease